MSRIGKKPVTIPAGVEVKIAPDNTMDVKGPKGKLSRKLHKLMKLKVEGSAISVERPNDERQSKSLHGLTRTLISNMVQGVSTGFTKKLLIQGVGYRAEMKGKALNLSLGYSHPVLYTPPDGITIAMASQTEINITGADKELVGQVAATIREFRTPDSYKGKGVRYDGEVVKLKPGKAAATGAKK